MFKPKRALKKGVKQGLVIYVTNFYQLNQQIGYVACPPVVCLLKLIGFGP
jgi:hypothetical protein